MEVNEKNPLVSLQEEIKIFRKNEEAIYDFLALYQLLDIENSEPFSLAIVTLAEKLIHDLEDPEVTIELRARSDDYFLKQKTDMLYGIVRKYENIEECKKTCDGFYGSYREDIALKGLSYSEHNKTFCLFSLLLDQYPEIIYKFLVSEIPFQTRLTILGYVLSSNDLSNIKYFFSLAEKKYKVDYLSDEEWMKIPEKMKELLEAFNHNLCDSLKVEDILENLISNKREKFIGFFLNQGINLNNCYYHFRCFAPCNNNKFSTVGLLFKQSPSLATIKEPYEHDSYLEVEKEVRENNDNLILSYISRDEICEFISFTHFEVTEEKVALLARLFMRTLEYYTATYLRELRDSLVQDKQNIANAILHKAKNKQEYKMMSQYATLFLKLTDIDAELATKEEIKRPEEFNKNRIAQKRSELTTILKQMNAYAQKNVHEKRLIKEVEWKKENWQ